MLASCKNCGTTLRADVRGRPDLMSLEGFTFENIQRYFSKTRDAITDDRVRHFQSCRSPATDVSHAQHEAAHAVIGIVLGLAVEQVNIDAAVCCSFEPKQIKPLDDAIVSLAGPAAGQRHQRIRMAEVGSLRTCAEMVRRGSRNSCDYCLAMRKIAAAHPDAADDERLKIFERLEDRALGLVRQHCDAIDRVADALIVRGHLTGDQVLAAMNFAVDGSFLSVGNSENGGSVPATLPPHLFATDGVPARDELRGATERASRENLGTMYV